ncbi:MAG: HlyC/CorC family transporter [Nitrospinae bacterium]|nr:HlyC/CorC family transporter [Nitrospinota bacterium]
MDDSILPRLILLIILLGCSAFFSGCEAAFYSLSPLQLSAMRENKGRAGALVNSLLGEPRRLLVTIYIGNELVNVAIAAIATSLAIHWFGSLGVGIAIGGGTFLILLFGEIVPKTFSLKFAETYALVAAYPLKLFSTLVQPAQKALVRATEWILSLLGISRLPREDAVLTEEEFKTIVKLGEGEGALEADEREMIHNVMEFGETVAGDIMTPKIDMFALKADDTLDEIIPRIARNFYSRVPVYDVEEEHIAGILFTKELNRYKHLPKEKFNLKSVLLPPIFVPESKKIRELLQEFRKMKRHMAIVLDEYGSVSGLVTLEDIIEELVGEIDSEMRREERPVTKIANNTYRLSGAYSLSEFNRYFDSALPEEKFDTIGGLVFDLFGRVPRSGETVTHENFKFLVEKMKGPRILKLQLTLLRTEPPEANGSGNNNGNAT